jgi:pseudouridine synthase
MRLQKYLASCGIASRRHAETLIEEGRVTVNGVVAALGSKIDPRGDEVAVDGKPVGTEKLVYVLLNKPRGYVTTAKDTHARKTVLECLSGVAQRVFPVGRLDLDTEGVLLLTNDGELAHRLMHPRFGIKKIYQAWVRGQVSRDVLKQFQKGIPLEDGETAPAEAAIADRRPNATLLRLTLFEGRKREVKRMCEAVGHPVISLRRESFAGLTADELKPGHWRFLTETEIGQLKRLADMNKS